MKFKELKGMNVEDLKQKREEVLKELMKENAQVAIGTIPKNPSKLKNSKKLVARINLLLSEKEVKKKA